MFIRIRIRIQLITSCGSGSSLSLHADPDPDIANHFDADPDPDPTFQFDADLDPYPRHCYLQYFLWFLFEYRTTVLVLVVPTFETYPSVDGISKLGFPAVPTCFERLLWKITRIQNDKQV